MFKNAGSQITLENGLKGWKEKLSPDQVGFSFEGTLETQIQVTVLMNGTSTLYMMSPISLDGNSVVFTDGNIPETTLVIASEDDELSFHLFDHNDSEVIAPQPTGTLTELIRLIENEARKPGAAASGAIYAVCISGKEAGKLICFDWAFEDGTVEWVETDEPVDLETPCLFQVLKPDVFTPAPRSEENIIESKSSASYELGVLVGIALDSCSIDLKECVRSLTSAMGPRYLNMEKASLGLATQKDSFVDQNEARTWLTDWMKEL